MQLFKNKLSVVAIELGEMLAPVLLTINEYLSQGLDIWNSYSDSSKRVIIIMAAIAAGIAPVLIGLAIIAKLGAIALGAIGVLMSPITLVIGAVAGIGAALIHTTVGWSAALGYVKSFAMGALGFLANFSENVGILWAWIRDNWRNAIADVWSILKGFTDTMIPNLAVALETAGRLFWTFTGWVAGLFKRLFTVDFFKALLTGILAIGNKLIEFFGMLGGYVVKFWDGIKGVFKGNVFSMEDANTGAKNFLAQIGEDLAAGAEDINLAKSLGKVLSEQMGKMQNPLEGFESSIAGAPKFNLETGVFEEAGKQAGETVGSNAFQGMEEELGKQKKDLNVDLGVKSSGVEAVAAASMEAKARVQEYLEKRGVPQSQKDAEAAARQAANVAPAVTTPESVINPITGLPSIASGYSLTGAPAMTADAVASGTMGMGSYTTTNAMGAPPIKVDQIPVGVPSIAAMDFIPSVSDGAVANPTPQYPATIATPPQYSATQASKSPIESGLNTKGLDTISAGIARLVELEEEKASQDSLTLEAAGLADG